MIVEHSVGETVCSCVVSPTDRARYLSYSAGLNALAGPLHGLANQEARPACCPMTPEALGWDPRSVLKT